MSAPKTFEDARQKFWDGRFLKHGHTGWAAMEIYRYDQTVRLKAIMKTLFAASLLPKKGMRVLDVGCGTGDLLQCLVDSEAEFVGIDLSSKVIEHAAKRFAGRPNIRLEVASVEQIEGRGPFDLVTCVTVLQHVTDETDFRKAIHGLVGTLKRGGCILLLEMAPKDTSLFSEIGDHVRIRSREQWIEAFHQAGCRLHREGSYPQWGTTLLARLAKLASRLRSGEAGETRPSTTGAGRRERIRKCLLRLCYPLDHWLGIPTPSALAPYRVFIFSK